MSSSSQAPKRRSTSRLLAHNDDFGGLMPSRERLNEFIAVVESGDHAGAIERYYTEDSSMQENAAPPRVGRGRDRKRKRRDPRRPASPSPPSCAHKTKEHTSELQSP